MSSIFGLHTTNTGRSASHPRQHFSARQISIPTDSTSRLVYLTDPEGLAVERYRLLRRHLNTLHPDGGVVLITSPSPGEGKTLTSVNLAWSFAEAGNSTCLVDLDFRAPGISRVLRYSFEEGGVQEVLEGKAEIDELVHQLGEHPLYVLGIKKRLASPGYLFYSQSMQRMISKLRSMFKWVLLDFAPVIPMADISEMTENINGAILVVRTHKTEKDMLNPAIEAIGSKLWGVVANDCPISGSAYYGSYGKGK
jgi:capsular exopolysaccharide synthesis family protein